MSKFFAELKRRHVYKVAVTYAVVGWVVIQVAATIVPGLHLPAGLTTAVIVLTLLGFPVALLLAWAFDLTPQGLQRASLDQTGPCQPAGHVWIYIVIAGVLLSVGLFFAGRYTAVKQAIAPNNLGAKSIAVLPFENLSNDQQNAYFTDGIQDEILTRLAQLSDLRVISRTSTEKYKSAPENLREIGKQLGVDHLLEGRVQKIGNAVHINVQLIRVETDEHLWAQSYDRQLNDVFAVEGEVATAIAGQLKTKLSGTEKQSLAAPATRNSLAYEAYLRGLACLNKAGAYAASTSDAITAFSDAVRLDPQFGAAWARLSRAHSFAYFRTDQTEQHREGARTALETAEKLGPELNETHAARGYYLYWVKRDYDAARIEFEQVRALFPNDAFGPFALAAIARRQGRWKESRALFDQALAIDPRNLDLLLETIGTAGAMRDWQAVQRYLAQALDVSPGDTATLVTEVAGLQSQGEVERAQVILDQLKPEDGNDTYTFALSLNALFLRKYDRALAWLTRQVEKPELQGTNLGLFQVALAEVQRHSGNTTAAKATYQEARSNLEKVIPEQPDNTLLLDFLAFAESGLGDNERALAHAQEAVAVLPSTVDAYNGPALEEILTRIEARCGKKEAAIEGIEKLLKTYYAPPNLTPALLRLDPDFDSLRDDPRFQKLIEEKP